MRQEAVAGGEPVWRPSPRIAALLNVVVPGLGRLYLGQPVPAVLTHVAVPIAIVVGVLLSFVAPGRLLRLLLLLLLVPGMWLVLAWDAHRAARACIPSPRQWWQRPLALAVIGLAIGLTVQPLIPNAISATVAGAYRSPTISMQPTIMAGDWFFTSKLRGATPQRGDIVLFDAEGGPRVFRVAGVAGDTMAMVDYQLTINGRPHDEPYARLHQFNDVVRGAGDAATAVPAQEHTWGPLVVPFDRVFVLGDTRNAAADSRYNGFVALGRVRARPEWVYFSRDPETGAIRWSRLGAAIE